MRPGLQEPASNHVDGQGAKAPGHQGFGLRDLSSLPSSFSRIQDGMQTGIPDSLLWSVPQGVTGQNFSPAELRVYAID
jgi:hypothetical protein